MKLYTVAELTKMASELGADGNALGVVKAGVDVDAFVDVDASMPTWMKDILLFVKQWTGPDDFIDVKTSGSTGWPKVIRHPKSSMLASAKMTCDFLNLRPGMNALLCLSTRNIAGMMMVVRCFERGMNIVAVPPDGHPLKFTLADEEGILDFAAMVPAQAFNSLKDTVREKGTKSIDSIENLIIGGAPVSYSLLKELKEVPGNVYATFGMTETLSHVALRRLNGQDATDEYTALDGIDLSTGEEGNLILEVPYLPDPHVVTNDLVELTGEKTFRWLGRMDHVINTGGFKVFPELVESKIAGVMNDFFRSYLSTQRYFIAGVPDEKLGERIVLVVEDFERRPAVKMKPEGAILHALAEVLAPHEVPREFWYTTRFIETPTGKIIRTATIKKL